MTYICRHNLAGDSAFPMLSHAPQSPMLAFP